MNKKIEKNNLKIALNVLYAKKEKIYTAYVSNQNSNREKQVILLTIQKKKKKEQVALSSSKTIICFIKICFVKT